jgi:hypothetical protein
MLLRSFLYLHFHRVETTPEILFYYGRASIASTSRFVTQLPLNFSCRREKQKRHPAHTIASDAGRWLQPHKQHREMNQGETHSPAYMYIRVFGHTMTIESTQHNKQRADPGRILNMGTVCVVQQHQLSVYASSMRVLFFYFIFSL